MRGGWPVYRKRDDLDWWLEYDACPQKWMIRPTACRGTTRGRAYIFCEPHFRPEQAKGVWRLSDGKGGWAAEPTVQVRTEAEAVVQDRVLFHSRKSSAVDVDIRGACKPVSHINGIYEPTETSCNGWPVYKKRGGDSHWLEYHSYAWQVKPNTFRGTKKCWAYVQCDSRFPEYSEKPWYAIINGEHVKQESITMRTLEEQTQSDRLVGNLRKRDCCTVKVTGAEGPSAESINGVYEPSVTELCGGWPVFCRKVKLRDDPEAPSPSSPSPKSYLIFSPYAMSWAITVLTCSAAVASPSTSSASASASAGSAAVPTTTSAPPGITAGNAVSDPSAVSVSMSVSVPSDTVLNDVCSTVSQCPRRGTKRELPLTFLGKNGDYSDSGDGQSRFADDVPSPASASASASSFASSSPSSSPSLPTVSTITTTIASTSSSSSSAGANSSPSATVVGVDEVKSPQTLAFLEVCRLDQPESFLNDAQWKVLVDGKFELQPLMKLTAYVTETVTSAGGNKKGSGGSNSFSGKNGGSEKEDNL
jgi:hypothetical protein